MELLQFRWRRVFFRRRFLLRRRFLYGRRVLIAAPKIGQRNENRMRMPGRPMVTRWLPWHWKSKSMAGTKTHFHSDRNSTPDLRPFAGEWVVLRDDVVIEHGTDLKAIVDKARAKGIERPRVLFVEGRDPETVRLGL